MAARCVPQLQSADQALTHVFLQYSLASVEEHRGNVVKRWSVLYPSATPRLRSSGATEQLDGTTEQLGQPGALPFTRGHLRDVFVNTTFFLIRANVLSSIDRCVVAFSVACCNCHVLSPSCNL